MNKVANLYNQLFVFESYNKEKLYPIHKKLNFDNQYEGLSDWILKKVAFQSTDHILDIGCGTGYTLSRIIHRIGCSGLGISLSDKEIEFATSLSRKGKNSDRIQFKNEHFDTPLEMKFDKMIAIESLKHSPNIEKTLKNLTSSLNQDGILVVADDFLVKNSTIAEKHKELWQTPSFIKLDELKKIIQSTGDFEIQDYDLTSGVRLKKLWVINLYTGLTSTLIHLSGSRLQRNLKTYKGAMLLEKLYRTNQVNYKVLIAKKK